MESKLLLVIDMQNDFVTGALANEEAQKIVDEIANDITTSLKDGYRVFFTRDTHDDNYLNSQEGKLLPVEHCIKGTEGWQIVDGLSEFVNGKNVFDKPTFGSLDLPEWIEERLGGVPDKIKLVGVCTDICVISNAMILKAAFSETEITVDSHLCAGVGVESHKTAIDAMKGCQINILGE